jgi:enterobacteria phage integrase
MTLIKLPYVKVYRDRHGRVRRYFHRKGQPDVALPGLPGSEEFAAAYQAALAAPPKARSRHAAGTLARLVEEYYQSVEFTNLKPSSRALYQGVLDPVAKRDGHRFVHDMPRDKVRKIIQEIGEKRPGMANLTRKALRRLLTYAVDNGWRTDNPVVGIPQYKLGTHHTWTDAELAAFEARWPIGTRERLVYALLACLGQRIGDTSQMKRGDIAGGAITVKQEKTGAELEIPLHPEVVTALREYPVKGIYLIGDKHGRPIGSRALSALMKRAIRAAGLPDRCVPHGLRKALMRRLAESSASTKEIASVSGHRTLAQIEDYTRAADQRKLSKSAMAKLADKK